MGRDSRSQRIPFGTGKLSQVQAESGLPEFLGRERSLVRLYDPHRGKTPGSVARRSRGWCEPCSFAAQSLTSVLDSVSPRNAAREEGVPASPTRIRAFTVMVTMPGIGVVANRTQTSPRTIHAAPKSSALT
jgi:hypothetical protein